jgi:hypothetical protein
MKDFDLAALSEALDARRSWPRTGGVLAMAAGGATGRHRRIGRRDL